MHPGHAAVLYLYRLHAEGDVGGERDAPLVLLDLEVVIDALVLEHHVVALPEGEGVVHRREDEGAYYERADGAPRHPPAPRDEEGEGDYREYRRENEEGPRRADRRDGDEGGQEGADDAAYRVERLELAERLAVVVQALGRVFHQRGRHGAEQHEREDEEHEAGAQRGPDEEVRLHEERQQPRHARYDPAADEGYERRPDCDQQQALEKPLRLRMPVRAAPAPDVAYRHGYHDGADDDRPDYLRAGEIRREKPARAELYGHDGHAREERGGE